MPLINNIFDINMRRSWLYRVSDEKIKFHLKEVSQKIIDCNYINFIKIKSKIIYYYYFYYIYKFLLCTDLITYFIVLFALYIYYTYHIFINNIINYFIF